MLNHPDDNFVPTFISQIEDKLNAIIKRHYKQDESIQIQLRTIRDNKLNLVIKDNTRQSFSIDERSPGFRYYFSFLVNKLYTKRKNGTKNTILLLDEPGANLYPKGAKDLLKTFDEIAESTQILYTTHNLFLTIRNCVDSLIYVTKSPTVGTKVNRKSFLNKYQIFRKELGILLNDSFLIGDINLVVEGATEKLAFHRLFQLDDYQELQWLNIYDAGGVTNISQALNYLGKNNLNLAGIVFMDSDKEAEDEREKKAYKKSIAEKKWEAHEVNDVFKDKSNRTFEDLFPQQLYVDSFNEYCNGLKHLEVFDKPYTDYELTNEIETPIIKELSDHFFSFINEDNKKKNSITKQDVIRILFDKVDAMDENERKTALKNILAILDKIKTTFKKIEKYVSNQA